MAVKENLEDRHKRLIDGPRVHAVSALLGDLIAAGHIGDEACSALAMLIIDAALDGDEAALQAGSRQMQSMYRALTRSDARASEETHEDRGRVLAFLDVLAWGLERSLSLRALGELEQDSTAHEFLKALSERPGLSNSQLADEIGISNAEVSRIGRRLADTAFAVKRRIGRRNNWELTPKGLQTLELLEGGGATRFQRPHLQLR